jgi:hypothetical protein
MNNSDFETAVALQVDGHKDGVPHVQAAPANGVAKRARLCD